MTETDVLDKVRKLLEHAASTNYEAEASTYIEHAQRLMTKFAITETMLSRTKKKVREEILVKRIQLQKYGKLNNPLKSLAGTIAENVRCRCVIYSHRGKQGPEIELMGFESDIAFAELLYTSLEMQMVRAMETSLKEEFHVGHATTWKTNFAYGYVSRISGRLFSQGQKVQTEEVEAAVEAEAEWGTTESVALALRDRKQEVDDFVSARYPKLGHTSYNDPKFDGRARQSGRNHADRADLSGGTRGFREQGRLGS